MSVTFQFVDRTTPLGATIIVGGVTFRTWTPRAQAVYLLTGAALTQAGTAGWTPSPDDRLTSLDDETWGGFLAGSGDGTAYMFWVVGAGSSGLKRDSYARELTAIPAFPASWCIVRDADAYPWHDAGWRAPAFNDLVLYQLHVGTWWAVDQTGADIRATRGGRFLDVATRLGFLAELGVNAIQLLPIQEFATQHSGGYNGVDYFSPEQLYQVGTDAELGWYLDAINAALVSFGQETLSLAQIRSGVAQLKCLIDLAHLHGIAVVFDLVYNHAGGDFGDQSLWFYDRFTNSGPKDSLYFSEQEWSAGQVFAFSNAHVRQFLIDNAVFFLNEYRIDGIRYDEVRVISNNRPDGRELCQDITGTVRFVRPGAIQIAEYWEWDRASPVTAVPDGLGFDTALGDGLRDAVRGLLSQAAHGGNGALGLTAVAEKFYSPTGYDASWRLVQCLENQDVTYQQHEKDEGAARVAMLADPSDRRSWYARSRSRAATCLLFAAPGIPALFMGQEILEDKLWSDDEDNHPGHLIWWDGLTDDTVMSNYRIFMQDLVHLRRRLPALRGEGVRVSRANDTDRVIVVHRWIADGNAGQDVVAVFNFDEHNKFGYGIGLPFAGRWSECFNSDFYDGLPNPAVAGNGGSVVAGTAGLDGFDQSALITIPANGAVFLTQSG